MKTKISSLVLCLLAGVLFTTGCGSSNNEVVEPIQDSAIRVILDANTQVAEGDPFYEAGAYRVEVRDRNDNNVLPIYDLYANYDANDRMIVDLYGVPATAAANAAYDVLVTAYEGRYPEDYEGRYPEDGFQDDDILGSPLNTWTRVAGPITTIHGQTIDVGDGTAYEFYHPGGVIID